MEPFSIIESSKINEPRSAVVGFGSNGSSVIELMESKKNSNIELIRSDENINQIQKKLEGVDIVFLTGELGDQEYENSALRLAKITKDIGILTIGIITESFDFDRKEDHGKAEDSFQELKKESDSVIVIPKDISENLKIVDIIEGILGVIYASGDNDISLDLIDLKTVMSYQGIAVAGIGEYQGKCAALNAMINAQSMPNDSIKNASGILVHFTMHPEFYFMQLSEAMDIIHNSVEESADVIFGTTTDETLPIDYIRITLIATGFEKSRLVPANNIL